MKSVYFSVIFVVPSAAVSRHGGTQSYFSRLHCAMFTYNMASQRNEHRQYLVKTSFSPYLYALWFINRPGCCSHACWRSSVAYCWRISNSTFQMTLDCFYCRKNKTTSAIIVKVSFKSPIHCWSHNHGWDPNFTIIYSTPLLIFCFNHMRFHVIEISDY